jgi:hypothetical protein
LNAKAVHIDEFRVQKMLVTNEKVFVKMRRFDLAKPLTHSLLRRALFCSPSLGIATGAILCNLQHRGVAAGRMLRPSLLLRLYRRQGGIEPLGLSTPTVLKTVPGTIRAQAGIVWQAETHHVGKDCSLQPSSPMNQALEDAGISPRMQIKHILWMCRKAYSWNRRWWTKFYGSGIANSETSANHRCAVHNEAYKPPNL